MYYYYKKCLNFIDNATSTAGFYDGIRAILKEANEKSTFLKNLYPEDHLIKKIQRAADAKYIKLEARGAYTYAPGTTEHDDENIPNF